MSYRLLKIVTLSSVCIFSVACTSTYSPTTAIVTPLDVSEWETRLPGDQGAVKITFTLPQHARAEFQLFNSKPSHISYAVARVTFSDENCVSGHLAAINYKKTNSEYFIQYFEKEAAWNNINTITLRWNTDDQVTTILNGETIHTDTYNHVKFLKITSDSAPIKIQTLEYLPL